MKYCYVVAGQMTRTMVEGDKRSTVKPGCNETLCNEFLDLTKFFNSPLPLALKPMCWRLLCNEDIATVNLYRYTEESLFFTLFLKKPAGEMH